MLTEVRELVNFFARYLRFRVSDYVLNLFVQKLSDELLISVNQYWNKTGFVHPFPCFSTESSPELLQACDYAGIKLTTLRALVPEGVYTIRPGAVLIEVVPSHRTIIIWFGDVHSDITYDYCMFSSQFPADPPAISTGVRTGVSYPPGNVINDIKLLADNKMSFLSDELMGHYQIFMVTRHEPIKSSRGCYTGPRLIATYNPFDPPRTLEMNVVDFHQTRFGALRSTAYDTPQRPNSDSDDEVASVQEFKDVSDPETSSPRSISPTRNDSQPNQAVAIIPISVISDLLTKSQKRLLERLGYL
uniref:Uncharacterized protein n=1 Tax=Panagrolaimus sp. JU765 TaxID=591449 RepID=A0AC34RML2_9BILA